MHPVFVSEIQFHLEEKCHESVACEVKLLTGIELHLAIV